MMKYKRWLGCGIAGLGATMWLCNVLLTLEGTGRSSLTMLGLILIVMGLQLVRPSQGDGSVKNR